MKIVLLVIVAAILIGSAITGYHKGLVKTLVSMLSLIIGLVFVYFCRGPITGFLQEHTPLYESVRETAYEKVTGQAAEDYSETLDEYKQSARETFIPDIVVSLYEKNVPSQIQPEQYAAGLSEYVAALSVTIGGSLITLLAAVIVLRVIIHLTGLISKIPLLGNVNKILGAALGLAKGLIVVALFFVFITMFSNNSLCREALAAIKDSSALSFLYDGVMGAIGGLF